MLQFFREKITGRLAIVLLALLCVPFAFVGLEQYLVQRNATWVAQIQAPPKWWSSAPSWWPVSMVWQREEISAEEFRTAFDLARMRAREDQGEAFDPRQFESVENKRVVLESMVDERLMRMQTQRDGMVISDLQVATVIRQDPAFQVDGQFNMASYQAALANSNPPRTPSQYDNELRTWLQSSTLNASLLNSSFSTASELERILRLQAETRDLSAFVLPVQEDSSEVDDAQVQSWYNSHQNDYSLPETVTLEYIQVDEEHAPTPAAPDEAALRAAYEQNKSRYGNLSSRLISHILLTGADAQAQAEAVATQARAAGADFAALARTHSKDTGSSNNGGELGWITQDGSMGKAFEEAAFGSDGPGIVGPVQSEFGWHVIAVREVRDGNVMPFEQVRDALVAELTQASRERAYSDLLAAVVDEIDKNPNTLQEAARVGGVQVQELGPLTAQGAAIDNMLAHHPTLLREAFSDALIQDRTVSQPIEVAPGQTVLIRVKEHTPGSVQPLQTVRDAVVAAVRADRASKALQQKADGLIEQIRTGTSIESLARAENLQVSQVPNLNRMTPMLDPTGMQKIFSQPAPTEQAPSAGRIDLPDGSILVYQVTKVTAGDTSDVSDEERTTLRAQLAQVNAYAEIEALRKALRQRYRIAIEESRL